MSPADPAPWLLLVAAAHLGFQLTVDLVVYPALGDVGADGWAFAHERHSRRITPVVAAIYPPLVAGLVWAVLAAPGKPGAWLAAAGGLLSVATTAAGAAPTHARLASVGAADRPALLGRLDRADRVRSLGAVICVAGAVWLAVGS